MNENHIEQHNNYKQRKEQLGGFRSKWPPFGNSSQKGRAHSVLSFKWPHQCFVHTRSSVSDNFNSRGGERGAGIVPN